MQILSLQDTEACSSLHSTNSLMLSDSFTQTSSFLNVALTSFCFSMSWKHEIRYRSTWLKDPVK